ncbi:Protein MON [Salix suchowensis]|nr:Protein MON [Salix suchowensis]
MELDGERLYAAIQRLFDSTTGVMDDEAFGAFVRRCLGDGGNAELVERRASGAGVHLYFDASGWHCRERKSGIAVFITQRGSIAQTESKWYTYPTDFGTFLRSGDFGISKLLTVSLLNIHRLIYRAPRVAWEPTTMHLLSVIRDEKTTKKDSKEKLGAPQGIRIQAAKALDEILVNALKSLGSGVGMGDKKGDVQQRVLDVLGKQVILIPDGGPGTVGITIVDVELRKMGLETLHEILQNSAHTLVVGWEKIFEMLGAFVEGVSCHWIRPARGQTPREKCSDVSQNRFPIIDAGMRLYIFPPARPSSLVHHHLRSVRQATRHEYRLDGRDFATLGVSDAIQSKRKTLSDTTEPAYKTYRTCGCFCWGRFWVCVQVLGMNGGRSAMARYNIVQGLDVLWWALSLAEWEECVWGILVPLFEKLSTATVAAATDATPSSASSPTAPMGTPSFAGERYQGWDDSKILAFHSLGSILHDFLADKFIRLESFARIWDFLVAESRKPFCGIKDQEERGSGEGIIPHRADYPRAGDEDFQPGELREPARGCQRLREARGDSSEGMGVGTPCSVNGHIKRPADPLFFWQDNYLIGVITGVLTYSSSPDYRPDIDSLSPAQVCPRTSSLFPLIPPSYQTSVMDTVNGIDLSAPAVSSLVMRDLSEYATLAFLAAFDVQPSTLTQTGPKRITYIALMKKTCRSSLIYIRSSRRSQISTLMAYSIPIKMKYDCPLHRSSAKILRFGKPHYKLPARRQGMLSTNERTEGYSASEEFPLEVQEAEENFDLALISSLEIDVLPYIGDSRVPDPLIRQLSKSCNRAALCMNPTAKALRAVRRLPRPSANQGNLDLARGAPEGSYGSTDLGTHYHENGSLTGVWTCSSSCVRTSAKVGGVSVSYVADEMIRGGLPFPEPAKRSCCISFASYSIYPMACLALGRLCRRTHALLHRDSPYVSIVEMHAKDLRLLTSCIAIDTTLPPSELVADAVKRSTVAHLFHMYDLLCDMQRYLASLPRRGYPSRKRSQLRVRWEGPDPNHRHPSSISQHGETSRASMLFRGGGVVEMDARTLARECLKIIGKELGVSR